ncbi:MAG: hypothetical protein GEU26_09430 [Nitrososphaeraceae archaeon]|nr:hypothetical protein [Nitrososphaeraceae archaeon]
MSTNSYGRAAYKYTVKKQNNDNCWYCKEQSRICNQCREPTIITYNLRTHQVETFELDDKYPEQRRKHRHPADNVTRASVISAIAVEKRNLFERRKGDYDPVSRRVIN